MGATGADPDLIADSLASGGGAEAGAPADAAEAEVNNASGGEYDSGGKRRRRRGEWRSRRNPSS